VTTGTSGPRSTEPSLYPRLSVYRWELDDSVQPDFDSIGSPVRMAATNFMDAVVLVDPLEYQRHPGEPADANKLLRTLHFGLRHEG
jgi:hypothetical protein